MAIYHFNMQSVLPNDTHSIVSLLANRANVPSIVVELGEQASKRFLTFFTDSIRNPNTRAAYFRVASRFFDWCANHRLRFEEIESFHVSAYIEALMRTHSPASVKQHLAGIRMLFDWLVVGQICSANPAAAVRGPRYSVTKGKTPILEEADAKRLLEVCDASTLVGLRDRALIATMIYSFGRISAVLGMDVQSYHPRGKRWWICLSEKGGKQHQMPAHHKLEEYLDDYLEQASFPDKKHHPLFPSAVGRTDQLTDRRLRRENAWQMIKRKANLAGIRAPISNHSFRGTGITNYLKNGGSILEAQKMACHADTRTTQLYDRRSDEISLDEIERITI